MPSGSGMPKPAPIRCRRRDKRRGKNNSGKGVELTSSHQLRFRRFFSVCDKRFQLLVCHASGSPLSVLHITQSRVKRQR